MEDDAKARQAKVFMEDAATKKMPAHKQTVPRPYNISGYGEQAMKAELRRQRLMQEKEEKEKRECTFRPKTNERPRKELIEKLLADDDDFEY
jgi:hypothetical protein